MAQPIDQLSARASEVGLSRAAVIAAVFALRAPRTLAGLVPAIENFLALGDRFPVLLTHQPLANFAERVQTLRALVPVAAEDPVFAGRTLGKNVERQLEPCCGDSGIVDALLTRQKAQGEEFDEPFRAIVAWFVWQGIRFNSATLTESSYEDYLSVPDSPSLRDRELGSTIYAAWLRLRRLGRIENQDKLLALAGILTPFDEERTARQAVLIRLATLKAEGRRKRPAGIAARQYGLVGAELESHVAPFRGLDWEAVGVFVERVWFARKDDTDPVLTLSRRFLGRESLPPQLRRFRDFTEVVTPIEADGVRKGVAIDYFPSRDRPVKPSEDDDPDTDESGTEPCVSIYLGDQKNLLQGFYAARGLQSAVEYTNAMLPWARWRLSSDAVRAVADLVFLKEGEDALTRLARLAIGLSLIAGRSLAEMAKPLFAELHPDLSVDRPVGIATATQVLQVRAGSPILVSEPIMLAHCAPSTDRLCLPIPLAWRSLVTRCSAETRVGAEMVARRARELLKELPTHLSVTEQGVRRSLARELLFISGGKLELVKAITDANDANFQNLIHYASFGADEAGASWRKAAEALVGDLPSEPINPALRVGAPHSFDLDKLASYFREIRQRFDKRVAEGNWAAAFNYVTLQTALWLALSTAGRKTTTPIPQIIISGGWALVDDKHRSDGSTDRLTPLTRGARAQLRAWLDFANHLSITHPTLDPYEVSEDGTSIRLHYVNGDGTRKPYQPRIQEGVLSLTPLPGNWARKLVRAESAALFGRMVDAGTGHSVRGRHPWRFTSTMAVPAFRKGWLQLQRCLEKKLGLRLLRIPDLRVAPRPIAASLPVRKVESHAGDREPVIGEAPESVMNQLRAADAILYAVVFETDSPPNLAAVELVRRYLSFEGKKGKGDALARSAEVACTLIRQKTKIPIFAARPRPLLARDWMIDSHAFQVLAWMEQRVLPAFHRDLSRLPAPREGEEGAATELGRLLMIAAWRVGLARVPVVEPFLRWVASDQPILATGELRYACIGVPPLRGNVDRMRRTVHLDDFVTTYLLVERTRLRIALKAYFEEPRRARRGALLQKAMAAYLAFLGVSGRGPRLSAVMDAAVQHFMLNGSPILAAYARGEFVTMDLDDVELRRLAGLLPYRASKSGSGREAPVNRFDEQVEEDPVGAGALPCDLRTADRNFVHALTAKKTPYFDPLLREVRAMSPTKRVEQLLQAFAVWLLIAPEDGPESTADRAERSGSNTEDRGRGRQARDKKPMPRAKEWNARAKKQWAAQVTVLGHALIGIAGLEDDSTELDGAMLERLEESCGEHFRESVVRGAWRQFRRFLRSREDLAGFTVVDLANDNERDVSARILRADQIDTIRDGLASARSGIGNPDFRLSATRLFSFASDFGARRGELEHLRTIDAQGDLLRIQPYNDHTLKTAWSARVVPLAFLSADSRQSIAFAKDSGVVKLIDPRPGINADGNNFFYAMNRVIKDIAQDENLGLHHLRHTVASRLLLSVLRPAVRLDDLFGDVPWLEGLLIEESRLNVLLGGEGPSGHGLQATTALLGHGHPTTTLHHYTHTVGIAFHALIRTLTPIDVSTSFENRLSSRTTAQRWATSVRADCPKIADARVRQRAISRGMRRVVECSPAYAAGVDVDERPAVAPTKAVPASAAPETEDAITFDRIEAIDREFRGEGRATGDPWVLSASRGMAALAGVATGKKGSSVRRHPMVQNQRGQWMPDRLDAQSATRIAADLTTWLQELRVRHPEDFQWLLQKWALDSERERGRMRLRAERGGGGEDEVDRAQRLPQTSAVKVEIQAARVARSRASATAVPRLRIRCMEDRTHDRDIGAVRWVMTWVAAIFWSGPVV